MANEEKLVEEIVDQEDNFSQWYNQIVRKAELADYAPVRGCMIIRPYGYAVGRTCHACWMRVSRKPAWINAYFPC